MVTKNLAKTLCTKMFSATSAVAVCTAILVSSANATPITYTISPGTTGTLSGSDGTFTETFSGSFTIDFSTSTESNVSFTLTGTPGLAGTYVDTPALVAALQADGLAGGKDACGLNGNNLVCLRFVSNLDGSVLPDPFQVAAGSLNAGQNPDLHAPAHFIGAVTGSVNVGTLAVPEPASLMLLGTALVGFGAIHRRRRKASA